MMIMVRRVRANRLQTLTELLSPQLFHQLSHLLHKPFRILFSHPCLRLCKSLNHVPPTLQDCLPNTELPRIYSRHTTVTSFQMEGQGLSFMSNLLLLILSSIFLAGIFHVEIFLLIVPLWTPIAPAPILAVSCSGFWPRVLSGDP